MYCANNPINYVDPSGHRVKRIIPKAGDKLWVCLKTTKKNLRKRIAPYFKKESTGKTFANWIIDQGESGVIDVYASALRKEIAEDFLNETIDSVMRYNTFLETSWVIGRVISNIKMNSIWKKIDKFYKNNLKGKEKDSKKVWYCHQLSFRRQGMSDEYYKPSGNISLTKGNHAHGRYEKTRLYKI